MHFLPLRMLTANVYSKPWGLSRVLRRRRGLQAGWAEAVFGVDRRHRQPIGLFGAPAAAAQAAVERRAAAGAGEPARGRGLGRDSRHHGAPLLSGAVRSICSPIASTDAPASIRRRMSLS